MTVMDPDGSLDTWYLEQGDVYFIPRAYPHHIEVAGSDDAHIDDLPNFPFTPADPLIVTRNNPLDERGERSPVVSGLPPFPLRFQEFPRG